VIGILVDRQRPVGHVLDQPPLDPPRRALPGAIRVEQHSQHHRRVVHRTTATVGAVIAVEPGQVPLGHHIGDEERKWFSGSQSRTDGGINNSS
jgi:hypothetical protein